MNGYERSPYVAKAKRGMSFLRPGCPEDSSYKYLCVNINRGLYCKIMTSIYNLLKSRFCSTLMNYMAEGFEFVYDTELFGLQSRILVCE